jgi:replication factor C subunit 2/4
MKSERIPGAPDFKIILLDEADHLTKDAQNALRRIIEDFTKVTRFVLVCNYITKIIGPIISRCMKFRFSQISKEEQIERLKNICSREGLQCKEDALSTVVDISKGDLRKALNLLQMAGSTNEEGHKVKEEDVLFISDVLPSKDVYKDYIDRYLKICNRRTKDLEKSKLNFIDDVVGEGVTAQQFISALHNEIRNSSKYKYLQKARVIVALTEAEESVLAGVNDFTVFSLLFAQLEQILK